MKKQDIRRIFTQKVSEYMANGYVIHPDTMSGSQGEIAKIDMTDGNEIIRIMLDRAMYFSEGVGFYGDTVTLTLGRATEVLLPHSWDSTIWNSRLEVIEKTVWAELSNKGDGWYIDVADVEAVGNVRIERWRQKYEKKTVVEDEAIMKILLRYVRKQPKMKTCKLEDMTVKKNGNGYEIITKRGTVEIRKNLFSKS